MQMQCSSFSASVSVSSASWVCICTTVPRQITCFCEHYCYEVSLSSKPCTFPQEKALISSSAAAVMLGWALDEHFWMVVFLIRQFFFWHYWELILLFTFFHWQFCDLHLVVEMLKLVMALIFCFDILSHHALFFNHISKSCLKVNEERFSSLHSEKWLIMWTCFLPCHAAATAVLTTCSEMQWILFSKIRFCCSQ